MKKTVVLLVAVLLAAFVFVSCSMESREKLCALSLSIDSERNIWYEKEELTKENYPFVYYRAASNDNPNAYGITYGAYKKYTEGDVILLSQGNWSIDIKCTKEDFGTSLAASAFGATVKDYGEDRGEGQDLWVNLALKTISFSVQSGVQAPSEEKGTLCFNDYKVDMQGYSSLGFVYSFYAYDPATGYSESSPLPLSADISERSESRYRVLSGTLEMDPGLYVCRIDIVDPDNSNAVMFIERVAFTIEGGRVTFLTGFCTPLAKEQAEKEPWVPTIPQTTETDDDGEPVGNTELTGDNAGSVEIKDETIYNVQPDDTSSSTQNPYATLSPVAGEEYRIKAPDASVTAFGINMNGTDVNVERTLNNNAGQNTTVIDLTESYVEFTLYNYVDVQPGETNRTATWGVFATNNSNRIRVEPDIQIGAGSIMNCTLSGLSNGGIVIKGPEKENGSYSKGDSALSSTNNHFKLGAFNFKGTGGTINLAHDVTVESVKGITCQNNSDLKNKSSYTYLLNNTAISSGANLNIYLSDGAKITSVGDSASGNSTTMYNKNDTANCIYLVENNATNTKTVIGVYGSDDNNRTTLSATSSEAYKTSYTSFSQEWETHSSAIFISKGRDISICLEGTVDIIGTSYSAYGYGIYLDNCSNGTRKITVSSDVRFTTNVSGKTGGTGIYLNACGTDNKIKIESLDSFSGCTNVVKLAGTGCTASLELTIGGVTKTVSLSANTTYTATSLTTLFNNN